VRAYDVGFTMPEKTVATRQICLRPPISRSAVKSTRIDIFMGSSQISDATGQINDLVVKVRPTVQPIIKSTGRTNKHITGQEQKAGCSAAPISLGGPHPSTPN